MLSLGNFDIHVVFEIIETPAPVSNSILTSFPLINTGIMIAFGEVCLTWLITNKGKLVSGFPALWSSSSLGETKYSACDFYE